jgi:hypothetical protein
MIQNQLNNKSNVFILTLIVIVYAFLTIITFNNCYFWDNIQQISNEAHWFYLNDFRSLLTPAYSGTGIVATGYHPPLMGIMTAVLWMIFGCKLWVSHVFILLWAIVLIFNVWKLIRILFPVNYVGWVVLILLMESSLLSQYAISSPDFILFTAFVVSLRAMLERKPWLLAISVFFLCCINMRGIFVGVILFIVHIFFTWLQSGKKIDIRRVLKITIPYLPTFILLVAYFTYYFIVNGWFFSGASSTGHYSIPNSLGRIIKHLAEFGLRSIENGRFIIWFTGLYIAFKTYKSKIILSQYEKVLLLFFLLLTGLYVLFIFVTQMPFSARYFMPQFFLLSILAILGIIKFLDKRKVRLVLIIMLLFELTGNLWIYPEKIAKSWDCTLAHLPYYELRKECFNYIDHEKVDYKDLSGGFCFYGNRDFVELTGKENIVSSEILKYYIYSNISNVNDSLSDALHNRIYWTPVKRFEKWPVYITIYRNNRNNVKVKP